jgi:ABC-type dipeptide/oligopeptide/nickel transport system ATPase component
MLSVRELRVGFLDAQGTLRDAVHAASLTVHPGQIVAVVGESGSGKSVTALALMGLLPPGARTVNAPPLRGKGAPRLAMIFQEPAASLNPSMSIGDQIAEAVTLHQGLHGRAARAAAAAALAEVGISDPDRRLAQFPHEFSGGMCQRVMIAMALACQPAFLIADEPTLHDFAPALRWRYSRYRQALERLAPLGPAQAQAQAEARLPRRRPRQAGAGTRQCL